MSYKLICIDMDGTLLNDEKKISKEDLKAIKKAHDKGVKIAVCTGRLFASAKYYGELLEVKIPIISSNGAYIREKDKDLVLHEVALDAEKCTRIQSIVEKYEFHTYFEKYNEVISKNGFPKKHGYRAMNKNLPHDKKIKLTNSEDIIKTLKKMENKILKCITMSNNNNEIEMVRKELLGIDGIEIASSGKDNIEIMSNGVSKGKAIQMLAEFYNISYEEVMCIGDSENDLSMIKYAGMGIAMGNGCEIVKQAAQFITDINNNSGVAKVIERFIL